MYVIVIVPLLPAAAPSALLVLALDMALETLPEPPPPPLFPQPPPNKPPPPPARPLWSEFAPSPSEALFAQL